MAWFNDSSISKPHIQQLNMFCTFILMISLAIYSFKNLVMYVQLPTWNFEEETETIYIYVSIINLDPKHRNKNVQ